MTTPTPEPKPIEPIEPPKETPEERVSREAYEKVLKEKKNVMAALEQERAEKKRLELEALKAKEDWKTLAEQKEQEATQWKTRYEETESKIKQTYKLTAVKKEFEKLGADSKSLDFLIKSVDLSKVDIDESTQVVLGAEDEAKRIKEALPQVFGVHAPRANHDAPRMDSKPIDLDSFKSLPLEEKKKRLADLYKAQGITLKP